MILYGISNCDTVRKARKWLSERDVEFAFHDFRKDGLCASDIEEWLQTTSGEILLNKRGTTWRQLPGEVRDQVNTDDASAFAALLAEHPTLIKRPVLQTDSKLLVGFKADEYESLLSE